MNMGFKKYVLKFLFRYSIHVNDYYRGIKLLHNFILFFYLINSLIH